MDSLKENSKTIKSLKEHQFLKLNIVALGKAISLKDFNGAKFSGFYRGFDT